MPGTPERLRPGGGSAHGSATASPTPPQARCTALTLPPPTLLPPTAAVEALRLAGLSLHGLDAGR